MTAFVSILGKQFGRLVVIDESERGPARKVRVRCDCGNVEMLHAQRTREGKYEACSKCRPRLDPTFRSMLGQRFGKLVVIGESETGSKRRVLCLCECGRKKLIKVGTLREGRATTCGTCNRSMDRLKSVVGQKFGKLTVIAEPEIKRNRRVTCRCECGRVVSRLLSNLKRGQTKSCGCTKWYEHESGYIYFLLDPITKAVRYVGQSVQQPGVRLSGHVYNPKPAGRARACVQKKEWIKTLRPLRPEILVVDENIPIAELDKREQQYGSSE